MAKDTFSFEEAAAPAKVFTFEEALGTPTVDRGQALESDPLTRVSPSTPGAQPTFTAGPTAAGEYERPGFAAGFTKGIIESQRPLGPGGVLLRAADALTGGYAQERYNKANRSVLDDKTDPALAGEFAKPAAPQPRATVLQPRTDTISPTGGVVDALAGVPANTARSLGSSVLNFGALAAELGLTIQSPEQFRAAAGQLDKAKARTGLGVSDEPLARTGTALDALIPSAKTLADYAPEGIKQLGMMAVMGPSAIIADAGARGINQARGEGLSLASSVLYGAGQAASEGVPEAFSAKFAVEAAKRIPLAQALRGDTQAVTTAFRQTAQSMGVELGSEQVSALGNWVVDKIAADPTATPDRLVADMKEAVKATIVQGPTMLAGAKLMQTAATGLAQRPEDRAAREIARAIDQTDLPSTSVPTLNPNLAAAQVLEAPSIDAAIRVAEQVVATPAASAAVDNIARLIGQPASPVAITQPESTNVSATPEIPTVAAGNTGSRAPEPAPVLDAGVGNTAVAGTAMDAGGVRVEPASDAAPLGASTEIPAAVAPGIVAQARTPAATPVSQEPQAAAPTASWVIREKGTGKVIQETFSQEVVEKLNTAKYEAMPIQQHLAQMNRLIKEYGEEAVNRWARGEGLPTNPQNVNTSAQPAQKPREIEQVGPFGRDLTPIAQGGKPFKTKAEADTFRKANTNNMRTVKQGTGFVLRELTSKELAAREKAAKRIAQPRAGQAGVPISAHAFIVGKGGLERGAMADAGFDRNMKVGNRWLFAGADKPGLTLAEAAELLAEAGYIREESESAAADIIKRSMTSPQYTAEGWERIAEAEQATRFEDHLAAQQEFAEDEDPFPLPPGYVPQDAELAGLNAASLTTAERLEIAALVDQAEAMGIYGDSILEDADRLTDNERDYYELARQNLQDAIAQSSGSRSNEPAGGNDQEGRGQEAQPEGGNDRGEDAGKQGNARSEGLTAPTQQDVLATQAERERIDREERIGKPALRERIADGKAPLLTFNTSAGTYAASASNAIREGDAKAYEVQLSPTEKERKAIRRAESDMDLADTPEERATAREQLQAAARPAIDRALAEQQSLTAPTEADVLAQQDRREQAEDLDQREQIQREASGFQLQAQAPEQRKDTTGDLLGGLSADDMQRGTQKLRDLRERLRSLEDRIVGAAGMAPGFLEDALRSRKVSPDLKAQRETLRADIRELAAQLGEKPAKLNLKADDGTAPLFSRGTKDQPRDLIIQHNLTAENLLHAERMGGIPVPSLAITKAAQPLENFGEITLLGDADMATPRGDMKVFGADIYSPRYPSLTYRVVGDAVKKINATLAPYRQEGDGEYYGGADEKPDDLTSYRPFKQYAAEKAGWADPSNVSWDEMKAAATNLFAKAGAEERIFQGFTDSGNRRYKAHTLDNVIAILKKELRGGENFNYGAGSLRAKFTPQFRTIQAIRNSKDRLITKEAFEKVKDEINKELLDLSYDMVPNGGFRSSDTGMAILEEGARIGMRRAAKGYDIDLSDDQVERANEFLQKLRNLPTAYFEAKALRAMDLSEFKVAVVPDNLDTDARRALEKRGVKIVTYPKGDTEARNKAIADASADNGLMFSRAQPFYSALSKSIEGMTPKALPGAMWKDGIKGLINKGAVKEDEVEWSGIREWLDLQTGKVSKDQVLAYLDANGVQVQEVTLGGDGFYRDANGERVFDDETGDYIGSKTPGTKYENYTLPGGQNYREVLLTLPTPADDRMPAAKRIGDAMARLREEAAPGVDYMRTPEYQALQKQMRALNDAPDPRANAYQSSHWGGTLNVIAHIRLNDRTDADGKRVLFVEEIQSDWGQEGKKRGFTDPAKPIAVIDKKTGAVVGRFTDEVEAARDVIARGEDRFDWKDTQGTVPVAPFVTATDKWLSLALKRIITMAAQEGYDKVAFVNGEQSAERYDLSKQVDKVEWFTRSGMTMVWAYPKNGERVGGTTENGKFKNGQFSGKDIADVLGKDMAEKIANTPEDTTLTGDGLRVGGHGMISFYDKIVPTAANKLLAKLGGGKVGEVELVGRDREQGQYSIRQEADGRWQIMEGERETQSPANWFSDRREAQKAADMRNGIEARAGSAQPGFTITPDMREKASAGLPLFRKGADQTTGLTPTQFTQALSEAFGPKVADRLQAKGVVVPLADQTKLPAHVVPFLRDGDIVFGFYDPRTNRTYAVLENLTPGMVKGLAMHEVGVHYGFEAMLGADKYKQVMKQLDLMRRSGNVAVQKAHAEAVANAARPSQVPEETLAYLVQNNPENSVIKDVIARIKAWLFREFGIGGKYLTERDLHMLARAAVQHAARTEPGGVEVPAFMRAYHGTPHAFDKFSTDKIGTGEGAQAYGWGLYFAGKKEIAEHYRTTLAARANGIKVNGVEVMAPSKPLAQTDAKERAAIFAAMAVRDGRSLESKAREIEFAVERARTRPRDLSGFQIDGGWGDADTLEGAAKILRQWSSQKIEPVEGRLYEVEIPEEGEYLLWDKPLSEQPAKVRKAILNGGRFGDGLRMAIGNVLKKEGSTGQEIYKSLERQLGSDQNASERMLDLGIKGIKYLDGTSRAGGDGTYNYVVFSDDDVAIQNQPAFSRTPQTETKAFKDWFGDSKVVDAEGRPLVVYHGTTADLSAFDLAFSGSDGVAYDRPAIFATDDARVASDYARNKFNRRIADAGRAFQRYKNENPGDYGEEYEKLFQAYRVAGQKEGWDAGSGANVLPLYLSIQNPLEVDGRGERFMQVLPDAVKRATDLGKDGVIARNVIDHASPASEYPVTVYIAFAPEQVKSATGNNGNFDPKDPDIRFSRTNTAQTADADPVRPELSPWRDATGRLQFAPGAWLWDKLGTASGPILNKLQLKAAAPELRRIMRQMKLDVAKAQEVAAAVAGEATKLTEDERAMVSDLIEKELKAGTIPPEHAVRLAAMINSSMEQQTNELVRLGMLTKDSADRWRGQYLPRYYESKLTEKAGDLWADAMRSITRRPSAMKGIKGKHLRGRGLYETIPESQLEDYKTMGWEVRDPDYQPGVTTDGTVQVWRDFTRQERDNMGEIRDAGFRFVMGYMQTQKDIALGKMFEQLAIDPEMSSRLETEKFSVRVPDGKAPGTEVKTYGKLAGRYVSPETLSQLSLIEESQSEALLMYRKALGIWKEGKTVLNPVSHINNTISNMSMAHFAGVSYGRADKYLAAMRDFAKKAPMILEAKDNGLFLGTLSEAELMNTLPEELKVLAQKQEGTAEKVGRTTFNLMTFYLRRPMGWAYQAEDTFFRYLIYKDARERGMEPQDAVDYAQKYIFTYDDLPKTARRIRDFGVPFFAYTYKAIPALLHTALTHPERLAAPAAVLWTINAAAYAIAAGDDEDDWDVKLRRYLTDPEYREKARAKEKLERELLPEWNKGTTSLMTPKVIRLGNDELTKLPLFIDVSRIIPGGDLFDVNPNAGGIPLPQPITPSHPLFTTAVAMLANKDLFFGKDLTDNNDTSGEKFEKRAAWLWKQFTPAVAAGNYHFERGMNALAQASGGEITWLPEFVSKNYTGVGRDGLPVQPKLAALQTFGIKIRPYDLDKAEQIQEGMRNKLIREIDAEMRSLRRLNNLGAVSDQSYEKAKELSSTKKDRVREGKSVDGEDLR